MLGWCNSDVRRVSFCLTSWCNSDDGRITFCLTSWCNSDDGIVLLCPWASLPQKVLSVLVVFLSVVSLWSWDFAVPLDQFASVMLSVLVPFFCVALPLRCNSDTGRMSFCLTSWCNSDVGIFMLCPRASLPQKVLFVLVVSPSVLSLWCWDFAVPLDQLASDDVICVSALSLCCSGIKMQLWCWEDFLSHIMMQLW